MHKLRLHFPRINKKLQLAFSLPETTANLMLHMFYLKVIFKKSFVQSNRDSGIVNKGPQLASENY